jgi:hypothetical protein
MTGVYGAAERQKLTVLSDALAASRHAGTLARAAGHVADRLRRELPDLDDAAIGRVLVALTTVRGLRAMFGADEGASEDVWGIWATLAAAGLQLTEPEWNPEAPR